MPDRTLPASPGHARKIRLVGDPVLSMPCREVMAFDEELGTLIDDMFASMYVAEGVGLAAPQVGVDLRVFVYDCPDANGMRQIGHLVNPVLGPMSEELDDSEEGCLSVPGPYHELERPARATVRGFDRNGQAVEVTGSGFFARCLLHEFDHLKGLLFIDRLPRNRRRKVLREVEPYEWNAPLP